MTLRVVWLSARLAAPSPSAEIRGTGATLHCGDPSSAYCTDIFLSTKDICRDFGGGEFCKTFSGKRIKGRGGDGLADIGVGATRREGLQERKYKVTANVLTGPK